MVEGGSPMVLWLTGLSQVVLTQVFHVSGTWAGIAGTAVGRRHITLLQPPHLAAHSRVTSQQLDCIQVGSGLHETRVGGAMFSPEGPELLAKAGSPASPD